MKKTANPPKKTSGESVKKTHGIDSINAKGDISIPDSDFEFKQRMRRIMKSRLDEKTNNDKSFCTASESNGAQPILIDLPQSPSVTQSEQTTKFSIDLTEDPKKICLHNLKMSNIFNSIGFIQSDKNYFVNDLPKVVSNALRQAKSRSDQESVFEFCTKLRAGLESIPEYQNGFNHKKYFFCLIADADPSVFFAFCRNPLISQKRRREFLQELYIDLTNRISGRDGLLHELAIFITRRLTGDKSACWPLLHGGPGTGKSYILMLLAESLNNLGINASTLLKAVPQNSFSGRNDDLPQVLLGSDRHWSNATVGSLFSSTKSSDVTLVILDEAEKGSDRNFLVTLLDPMLPLIDNHISGFFDEMDMRHKMLFFLTVNEAWRLKNGNDDPLWSRLNPIEVPNYLAGEMEEVLVNSLAVRGDTVFDATPFKVRKLTRVAIEKIGVEAGFRPIMAEVNKMLFLEEIGGFPKVQQDSKPDNFRQSIIRMDAYRNAQRV